MLKQGGPRLVVNGLITPSSWGYNPINGVLTGVVPISSLWTHWCCGMLRILWGHVVWFLVAWSSRHQRCPSFIGANWRSTQAFGSWITKSAGVKLGWCMSQFSWLGGRGLVILATTVPGTTLRWPAFVLWVHKRFQEVALTWYYFEQQYGIIRNKKGPLTCHSLIFGSGCSPLVNVGWCFGHVNCH